MDETCHFQCILDLKVSVSGIYEQQATNNRKGIIHSRKGTPFIWVAQRYHLALWLSCIGLVLPSALAKAFRVYSAEDHRASYYQTFTVFLKIQCDITLSKLSFKKKIFRLPTVQVLPKQKNGLECFRLPHNHEPRLE